MSALPADVLAEIEAAADLEFGKRPGRPLDHATAEAIRRLLPDMAEQEAA